MRVRDAPVHVSSTFTEVQDVRELAGAIVYDCRPPLLPVLIPLRDLQHSSVDYTAASSSLAAAPAEETPGPRDSVPERVAAPEFAAASSVDPGTDLEDELVYVSPVPTMISPLPDSDAALPVSPSGYLEPQLPALAGSLVPLFHGWETRCRHRTSSHHTPCYRSFRFMPG